MLRFTEFLSVWDELKEDLASSQQQSASLQAQITDLTSRVQRLMVQKGQIDKQIAQAQKTQNANANATTTAAAANATAATPGTVPSAQGTMAQPGVQ
jgi:uncharacterized protein (DUF3084 family)